MHGVRILEIIFSIVFSFVFSFFFFSFSFLFLFFFFSFSFFLPRDHVLLQRDGRLRLETKDVHADSEVGSEDCGRSGSDGVDGDEPTVG